MLRFINLGGLGTSKNQGRKLYWNTEENNKDITLKRIDNLEPELDNLRGSYV
jgi:hypothetical protein